MFVNIILLIIAVAIIVVVNVINYNYDIKKAQFIVPMVVSLALFIFSSSFVIIPTGYTGVRTTFGQIDSVTVQNGFNWKIPFVQSIKRVNNKQQDIAFEDKVWSETSNRTAIYYEGIVVTYQINPEKSAWIYANVADYKKALINSGIVASSVKASSKALSDTDATNRSIIEPLVAENLQKSLDEKYGENVVCINKVIINNSDFEDAYNQAIADKQNAQLAAEKQKIENQKAIDKAEADAKVKKTTAEADAEAKLISAQADAKANKLLNDSISDNIIKEDWIKKWNGQLPQYVAGEESSVMVGVGNNK